METVQNLYSTNTTKNAMASVKNRITVTTKMQQCHKTKFTTVDNAATNNQNSQQLWFLRAEPSVLGVSSTGVNACSPASVHALDQLRDDLLWDPFPLLLKCLDEPLEIHWSWDSGRTRL